jgi:hypothetical protein
VPHNAECRYAECHYAERRYGECLGAQNEKKNQIINVIPNSSSPYERFSDGWVSLEGLKNLERVDVRIFVIETDDEAD